MVEIWNLPCQENKYFEYFIFFVFLPNESHQLGNLNFLFFDLHAIENIHQIRVNDQIKSFHPNKI